MTELPKSKIDIINEVWSEGQEEMKSLLSKHRSVIECFAYACMERMEENQ